MISGEVTISDIRVGTNSQVPQIGMEAYIHAVAPVSVIIAITSKEPVCPRVELILKIIIILLIIFLGFSKNKPC